MARTAEKISKLSFEDPIDCIGDAEYAQTMKTVVEPYIAAHRELSYFEPRPGQRLRYAKYTADVPRATAVIAHGFTETLEKYDETVFYLLNRGYNVFLPEHRGHGLSYREIDDYSLTHIECFGDYVEDFFCFVNEVVKPQGVAGLNLIAHSMGGAIGAMAMEKQPELFDKAAMLSPMFGVNLPAPKPLTYALACTMCTVGRGKSYVMGQKPFSCEKDFNNSACACEERYDYIFKKYLEFPYMQGCAASYGWLRESIKLTDLIMEKATLKKIKTPVLVFSGSSDEVVSKHAHRRFVNEVASARLVVVPHGKHELFTDTARKNGALWREIFSFFET